jgi:hypothetical protein
MPHSYGGNPVADGSVSEQRDAVRFLAQDHTPGAMRCSDAEIAFALTNEANVWMAAASIVGLVLARLPTRKKVGSTEIERTHEQYGNLRDWLQSRGATHQMPYFGGLSRAGKSVDRADEDMIQGFFRRDMNDGLQVTNPPTIGSLDE